MSAIQSELPGMQQETRQFKPFTKSKANSNKQTKKNKDQIEISEVESRKK